MTQTPEPRDDDTARLVRTLPLLPEQRMPSPQLQMERTAAEARAHAAQAQSTARRAQAAAQRAADQALTARRWNTAAVLISTLSLGMVIAMLLGWL